MGPAAQPLLVHVGYTKALSTWLQRFLFGRDPFVKVDRREILRIYQPNALVFDPDLVRGVFDELLAGVAPGQIGVLSEERLSGDPHSGGHDGKEVADRLRALFQEARALIVVREQRSMLVSTYYQQLRDGGRLKPEAYFTEHRDATVPRFRFGQFEYHRLVEHYLHRFGAGSVLVLPMELFRTSPQEFVDRISRFAGVTTPEDLPFDHRVKIRTRPATAIVRRHYNRFTPPRSISPDSVNRLVLRRSLGLVMHAADRAPEGLGRRFDSRVHELVGERIAGRYEASNRRLAELVGIDLEALGYSM
jgi:Sulfotransferase domain